MVWWSGSCYDGTTDQFCLILLVTRSLLLTRYPLSMQRSKALIRSPAYIAELKEINRAECETLKKLWVGPECMDAILKFQSRKK
jgi:hypothetical protein